MTGAVGMCAAEANGGMGAGFKAAIVVVFTVAVVIGVLVGKAQKTQSAGVTFPTAPATVAPAPQRGHVAAIDNASGSAPARFIPAVLKVHVGEKVTWVNESSVVVGVVADNGAFDSNALSPGQKFAWTPSKPGQYTYASFNNPNESGTIVVSP